MTCQAVPVHQNASWPAPRLQSMTTTLEKLLSPETWTSNQPPSKPKIGPCTGPPEYCATVNVPVPRPSALRLPGMKGTSPPITATATAPSLLLLDAAA